MYWHRWLCIMLAEWRMSPISGLVRMKSMQQHECTNKVVVVMGIAHGISVNDRPEQSTDAGEDNMQPMTARDRESHSKEQILNRPELQNVKKSKPSHRTIFEVVACLVISWPVGQWGIAREQSPITVRKKPVAHTEHSAPRPVWQSSQSLGRPKTIFNRKNKQRGAIQTWLAFKNWWSGRGLENILLRITRLQGFCAETGRQQIPIWGTDGACCA